MVIRSKTAAPGYPMRGIMSHVPMHPDPDPGSPPADPPKPADPTGKPDPAPKPADPGADDLAAIIAQAKAEREAAALQRAELEKVLQATKETQAGERAAERRAYVRSQTLAVPLTDAQLDKLLPPEVDARTDAGKAALNKWREENPTFIAEPIPAPKVSLEETVKAIVGGDKAMGRRIFGARTVLGLITNNPTPTE